MFKEFFSYLFEILKVAILAFIIVVPIRYFLFQPFIVKGQSMEPNFEDGDYLLIDEISYRSRSPERGEVIVFKPPYQPSNRYIKRIIGLPGETIEIEKGKIFISGKPLDESGYLSESIETMGDVRMILKENEYFVLGDNRPLSSDSRKWGVLPRENIIGRVFFRAFPVYAFSTIGTPDY